MCMFRIMLALTDIFIYFVIQSTFKMNTIMALLKKRFAVVIVVSLSILLIPYIANKVSGEWNWNLADFVVFGVMLLGAGFAIEFVGRKIKESRFRNAIIIALVLAFLLLWAELGVGIFGTPFAGS